MKKKPHPVLVLNASYVPIHVIEWTKAISLIYNDKVKCLDFDYVGYTLKEWLPFSSRTKDYYVLRSPNMSIALPEIVVTKTFVKMRKEKGVTFSRQNILSRDNNTCAYCGRMFAVKDLTLDHILPSSRGGKTVWNNIISACKPCNNIKANKTPEEAGMPLLFSPTKPQWQGGAIKRFPECQSWDKFLGNVESKPEYNMEVDE